MKYLLATILLAGCAPKSTVPLAELCVAIGIGLQSPLIAPDTPSDVCVDCDGRGWNGDGVTKITCNTCEGTGTTAPAGDAPSVIHTPEAPAGVNWVPQQDILTNDLPSWVHFWGESCVPCKRLEMDAFQREGVISLTEGMNCVKMELTPELAVRWGVEETPVDVWVDGGDTIIGRSIPPESEDFEFYLKTWKERLEL